MEYASKYGFDISDRNLDSDIQRLTKQIWKLIPMWENGEDWLYQLDSVLIEVAGLNELFKEELDFLVLLSKLEGLKEIKSLNIEAPQDEEFRVYRKTVFESITLLRNLL